MSFVLVKTQLSLILELELTTTESGRYIGISLSAASSPNSTKPRENTFQLRTSASICDLTLSFYVLVTDTIHCIN